MAKRNGLKPETHHGCKALILDPCVSLLQGDSGGPLNCFIDGVWTVQGVVSYGPSGMCNQYQKPTVFTRVSSFVNWIISVSLFAFNVFLNDLHLLF